ELDVRLAVAASIDRTQLARELHRGLAVPADPGMVFDLTFARDRLERAGWRESGSIRTRAGHLLGLVLLAAQGPHATRFLEAWQKTLSKVGVELAISIADGPGFQARLREGSFDLALCERVTPTGTDLTALVGSRGGENYGGFSSAAVDGLLRGHA